LIGLFAQTQLTFLAYTVYKKRLGRYCPVNTKTDPYHQSDNKDRLQST